MGSAQRPLPPPPGPISGQPTPVRATGVLPRRAKFTLFPPTIALAFSRLRQTWRLLLVTQLGVLAAVTLMCMIPLFSQVSLSAGLRQALTQSNTSFGSFGSEGVFGKTPATGSQPVQERIEMFAGAPSVDAVAQYQQTVDSIVRSHIGRYVTGAAQFSLSTQPWPLLPTATTPFSAGAMISLGSVDETLVPAHVNVVDGALPQDSSSELQIALTPETAADLHTAVGSTLTMSIPPEGPQGQSTPPSQTVKLHVVGLFLPQDVTTFWNGQDFSPSTQGAPGASQPTFFTALASTDSVLSVLSPLMGAGQFGGPTGPLPPGVKIYYSGGFYLTWTYTLDVSRITSNDLGTLSDAYNSMREDLYNLQGSLSDVRGVNPNGALDSLQQFQSRVFSVEVPITLLMLQIIGLVLLFVQLMANVLAERQAEAIAILRSRGAYRRQILGALIVQGLGLSVIAAVAGPLLAIPLVRAVAGQLLPASSQDALDVIGGNPITVARGILIFALIAAVGALIAVVVSLVRAANANIVALRRESARTATRPLWQRLHLDLVLALLAALAYTLYQVALAALGPGAQASLGALAVVWPILLLLAGAALFLRIFPLLLRLGSWLAARASGATAMLALSQMARAPRQSTRMMLLLALTTAFAIFTLLFTASQAQHLVDVTTYQVGADFSGTLPASSTPQTLSQVTSTYSAIPGVTSATAGYTSTTALTGNRGGQVAMLVMDSQTFATTALWSDTYSSQSLASLTQLMAAPPSDSDTVPAVVDDALASAFQVGVGGHFSVNVDGYTNGQEMRFVVVAVIHHIPTIYSSPEENGFMWGLLADYSTFASVYKQDTSSAAPSPNTVWLRTKDDADSLASVRAAVNSSVLALTNPLDRRQMLADQQGDPLQLNLVGTLLVGATTALALALIGGWIASWLNTRSRLTSFAVLRALGTTPRQILRVLLWEYGIIYLTSLALGFLFGWLLSSAALPALVFADALDNSRVTSGRPSTCRRRS